MNHLLSSNLIDRYIQRTQTILLDYISRSFNARLIISILIYIVSLCVTYMMMFLTTTDMERVPLFFGAVLINWTLGIRWHLAISFSIIITTAIILNVTDQTLMVYTNNQPHQAVVGFVLFALFGLPAGAFGDVMRMLKQQRDKTLIARDALAINERRYRKLIEESSDVVYQCDPNGYFTYMSPTVEKLMGYTSEELVGQHFLVVIPEEYHQQVAEFYQKQFKERTKETVYQFPIKAKNNDYIWMEQIVVLEGGDPFVTSFHSISRDISERRRLHQELEQAHQTALEASRFKSQILANVSHDARTPLSTILLVSEMLLSSYYGELNEQQTLHMKMILSSGNQLLSFLQNLLDKSQLDSGRLKLVINAFRPRELINQIDLTYSTLIESRNLTWNIHQDPEIPDILYGDQARLQQIVTNLLSNAVKFTRSGAITFRMRKVDNEHFAIEVEDTGIGITEDAIDHIFEAFWQVDGSATRSVQTGIGIGLSITKELVELMDGNIAVESELNKGTRFIITLPIITTEAEIDFEDV